MDVHIPDWDPAFLSRFDPDAFVEALAASRAQSVVLYAQSHTGLFNYPSRVGPPHRNLAGRDLVDEVAGRCRDRGIRVVLYVSVIHDRWASRQHPEWRLRRADGTFFDAGSRHGLVCPNSPYRDYVRSWVREIGERYEFDGIRFDMTFWPGVCYCDACADRWRREVGGDLPRVIDWLDERWVAFQRKREEWIADFAALCTGTVRELRPEATVEHQSSTYPLHWGCGAAVPLVDQNDFLQGDFYGDALQGSFVRKLLEALTPHRPFAYETSFALTLHDHTGYKSDALLEFKAAAAVADHGAFVFIDAIDPVGTVNPAVHRRMGGIFDRLMPYYPHLGGQRVRDVDVWYSLESKFDMRANGSPVLGHGFTDSHTDSVVQVVRRLTAGHLLFGVVTRRSLRDPARTPAASTGPADGMPAHGPRVLVLSNVHHMDREDCDAIRAFVAGGGAVYASGGTSLVDTRGRRQPDFMLADVFGVSLVAADWRDYEHYIAPTAAGLEILHPFTPRYPAFVRGCGFHVAARDGAEVLAVTTLPWPAPEPTMFASIHSDPPWVPTDRPEIVLNRFGRGLCIYAASPAETVEVLAEAFLRLLGRLLPEPTLHTDAPGCVEATLFHQPDRGRYLLSLLNAQKERPPIPVHDIRIRLRLPQRVRRVEVVASGEVIDHCFDDGCTTFLVRRLDTLAVMALLL